MFVDLKSKLEIKCMKKMLIITNPMDQGGAETFLMKIYRALDKTRYQFDFYVMGEKGFYDDEIISLGGRITYAPMKTEGFFKYKKHLKSFFKTNRYDYVYRALSNSLASLDLHYAKKYGNPKRLIARSANANSLNKLGHCIYKPFSLSSSNIKLAPSTEAAIFMFGKRKVKNGEVTLLMNGINTSLFRFQPEKRILKRKELGIIGNEVIFIHVGRFAKQKNHDELADIFKEYLLLDESARLICIGTGDTKENFVTKSKEFNIFEKIIFLEQRTDINELLMAGDIMLLPSLFEGLPNVVMEAQATGLPCLVSNTVTKECNATGLVSFEDLGDPKKWAEQCVEILSDNSNSREENAEKFPIEYDINQTVEQFIRIIFKD